MALSPFHLAIPVDDIESNKKFYLETLGCTLGRQASKWVDLNFFGHQLVLHQVDRAAKEDSGDTNPVDGKSVPVPHFGVVLDWADWENLSAKLKASKLKFVIEPYIRFRGEVGEQGTLFFHDPSGNALEFKAFKDPSQLFAS